jgi:SAM-dependent methyltransferase
MKQGILDDYLGSALNARLDDAFPGGRYILYLLPILRRRLHRRARGLRLPDGGGRLLDIGCGNGSFLSEANRLGWSATGIEIDPRAVRAGRTAGLDIREGGLPDTRLPGEHFDAVTLSHVIEHVHDPLAALAEVGRLLKPGGQVSLATPNLDSTGSSVFKQRWRGLEAPRHLVLFNPAALEAAVRAAGFVDVRRLPAVPSALGYFTLSWRMRFSEVPDQSSRCLPWNLRLRAALADARAFFDAGRAEDFALLARKKG